MFCMFRRLANLGHRGGGSIPKHEAVSRKTVVWMKKLYLTLQT